MKVSVIIPVYNVEKYLADCLNSVTGQTLNDIEIICIDDFSTDHSVQLLEKLAAHDHRIKILRNSANRGPAYTRNVGLSNANGEYVYFLDSDDMIVENALQELYIAAKSNQLDVIFFDGTVLYENDLFREKFKNYSIQRNGYYGDGVAGQSLFEDFVKNGEWSPSPPRQFWKRDFLINNDLKYENGILHEDELFSFLAIMKARRCSVIKKPYFIRRFRNASIMTKNKTPDNLKGFVRSYSKMLHFFIENKNLIQCCNAVERHFRNFEGTIKRMLMDHPEWSERLKEMKYDEKLIIRFLEVQNGQAVFSYEEIDNLRNKQAVIYGAGKCAKKIFAECIKLNVNLLGFAVSNVEDNPDTLFGYRVLNIERVPEVDVVIIIAVKSKEIQKEISEKVKKLGFKKIILPNI